MGARITSAAGLIGRPGGPTEFTLPWPPSVNHYWSLFVDRNGRPRMRLGRAGKRYQASAAASLIAQRARAAPPGRLAVGVTLRPPGGGSFDIDNAMKAVLDACTNAGVWADDGLIDELVIRRGAVLRGGLVEVTAGAIGS